MTQIRKIIEEFIKFQRRNFKSSTVSLAQFILSKFEDYINLYGDECIRTDQPEMISKSQTSRFKRFSYIYDESVLYSCLKGFFSGDYYEGPRIVFSRFLSFLADSDYLTNQQFNELKSALKKHRF